MNDAGRANGPRRRRGAPGRAFRLAQRSPGAARRTGPGRWARRRAYAIGGLLLALVPTLGGALLLYVAFVRPPENHPAAFLRRGRQATTATLVVSAGASSTHASLSGDYVALLRGRLGGRGHEFVNAGVNGDTSGDLLRRLDAIVACRPDAVTILIGTNDARAALATGGAPDTFRANLAAILARLNAGTAARVAVLSLPPLGEDLDSESNRVVDRYNAVIREVAAAHGAAYLPLHEELRALIEGDGRGRRTPYAFRPGFLLGNAVRRYAGRQSWDAIADRNGFAALTDGIHLSDRGAAVAARLIAEWLAPPAAGA